MPATCRMSQQPCLPVPKKRRRGKLDFGNIEQMDASDYLSLVVEQARRLPEVVSAKDPTDKEAKRKGFIPIEGSAASLAYLTSARTSTCPPPSVEYLPKNTKQWLDETLDTFSRLRDYLERCRDMGIGGKSANRVPVPPMKDRSAWHIFCVGIDAAQGNDGAYYQDDDNDDDGCDEENSVDDNDNPPWRENLPSDGYEPSVSLLLQFDQVMVRRVLSHLVYYVASGWSPATPARARWLYGLLARLEKPIHRDDASVLYKLLKRLSHQRAELKVSTRDDGRGTAGNGSSQDAVQIRLARINVLIAIVGIYFEQGGGVSGVMTVK